MYEIWRPQGSEYYDQRSNVCLYYLVVGQEFWSPAKCESVLPVALPWLSSMGTQIQLLMLYSFT
jgi:hypothetical protein